MSEFKDRIEYHWRILNGAIAWPNSLEGDTLRIAYNEHLELAAEIVKLRSELQGFVRSYDDWLGRQDTKPSIDLAENARQLLQDGK